MRVVKVALISSEFAEAELPDNARFLTAFAANGGTVVVYEVRQ